MTDKKEVKKLKHYHHVSHKHWVGNGFYVNGLIRPSEELNSFLSPFILADYAAPKKFSASSTPRGVGEHPHRGFETVTIAYKGEIQHLDSSGGGGTIKEGDVQWMTAGKGIVHQEYHSKAFTNKGGEFEMLQLWVNLPKEHKMTEPKYQSLCKQEIPRQDIGNNSNLRVIAGSYEKSMGPASTFTKINIFDIESRGDDNISLNLETATNTIILILEGHISLDQTLYKQGSSLIFEREGQKIDFATSKNFKGVILNAKPINEPVVAVGPFVMNSKSEIEQAFEDYRNGKLGTL